MATNIPPHNLGEVIDGIIRLIDHPDVSIDELNTIIKGPDFPTGAPILAGTASARRTTPGRVPSPCGPGRRLRR